MWTRLLSALKEFHHAEDGHAAVEYALVMVVIVGAILAGASALSARLGGK